MTRRLTLVVALACLLLLAGCSGDYNGPDSLYEGHGGRSPDTTVAETTAPREGFTDPATDRLGWEDGVWYDEPLPITPGDGLNDSELALVVDRSMARVELLRDLEFTRDVTVEVISREQYREQTPFRFEENPVRDQVYEALFLIDEDTTAASAFETLYGGSVGGYYFADQIVIVSDSASGPVQVDRGTLAHELTHALQDQRFSLRGGAGGIDAGAAAQALPEGEANYVMDRYEERCDGEWACLPVVERGGGGAEINRGLFLTVWVPYSDGPSFVEHLLERGGWAAVNDAWDRRPVSTEQVIHPETYPDETPVDVRIADRGTDGWRPVAGSATVGEAGVFAMLYANGVVPEESLFDDERRYNYSHPASAGWGGDAIRVYRNGEDEEFGYVFKTAWDTVRDAREFERAYRTLLDGQGATSVRDGVFRIETGGYADAFRVVRTGQTVTVVNAPSVADLDGVRGPGGPQAGVDDYPGDPAGTTRPLLSTAD
jgi:hypothetical protein